MELCPPLHEATAEMMALSREESSMTEESERPPYYTGRAYRVVSGVLGAVVLVVGIYALVFGVPPMNALRLGVGILLAALGGNLMVSAYTAKESWISRIGPLP
jgi:uncharacterized membrane protein HdeD (DUF308 family)